MPRTTLALTSFVSGEFSPKMDGRTDFEKYSSGAKTLENFLVHPQGAATRRVGTQFIAEVKSSAAKTRLIPFEFSTTQTYVMEFGDEYIRLLGVIRPEDINNQNTVQSSRIANAKISYTGAGDVADTSKKGWLSKLIDTVTPL